MLCHAVICIIRQFLLYSGTKLYNWIYHMYVNFYVTIGKYRWSSTQGVCCKCCSLMWWLVPLVLLKPYVFAIILITHILQFECLWLHIFIHIYRMMTISILVSVYLYSYPHWNLFSWKFENEGTCIIHALS